MTKGATFSTGLAARLQSLLFVPGNRPDRFAGALDSGADAVCIDLEDSVPAADKARAREAAIGAIVEDMSGRLVLRCNSIGSIEGVQDLGAIATAVGHFGSNYTASSAGRKWLLGGMGAAILSGLSWTIATTLYRATGG